MRRLALALVALVLSLPAPALDHSHPAWQALLARHVRYLPGGNGSQVAYADFMKDRAALRKVLDEYQDEPRVHVAVVCASVGCPMLRDEAFVAGRLEAQLEDAMRRFLSDRSRNRYNPATGKLEVSKVFDWYGKDFEKGHKGYTSVKATLAKYAELLADRPEDRAAVREQKAAIAFLDYDWGLNDTH